MHWEAAPSLSWACNGHRFSMNISNLDLSEIAISNHPLALVTSERRASTINWSLY